MARLEQARTERMHAQYAQQQQQQQQQHEAAAQHAQQQQQQQRSGILETNYFFGN